MATAHTIPPPVSPSPALKEILRRINRLETDGVAELEALHHEHPESTEVLRHLVYALSRVCRHERAIEGCERLLALDPECVDAELAIADRLVRLDRLDEAEKIYVAVHERGGEHALTALAGKRYVTHLRRRGRRATDTPEGDPFVRAPRTEHQVTNEKMNQEEQRRGALRLESMPRKLLVEGTTKCNFYCQTCDKGYGPYRGEDIQDDVWEKVRDTIVPSVTYMGITGFGEPTIGGRFDDLLNAACENACEVDFTTNGSALSIERIEQMIRHKVSVTVSCDGATKETFEHVRLGGNFAHTMDRFAMIHRLRLIHCDEPMSDWQINFVCLRQNIHELPEVVRIAKRFGFNRVNALDYRFNWNDFDDESLRNDPTHARACLEEAKRVAKQIGITLVPPPPYAEESPRSGRRSLWTKMCETRRILPKRNRFPRRCGSPWHTTQVNNDGKVIACCIWPKPLGWITKKPFSVIWNGWRYRFLRWRIHTAYPPVACRVCHLDQGINGGNAGNSIAQEGLIIRSLYWLEVRLDGLISRLREKMKRRRPQPAPNYYRGKPLTARNRPDAQP